ncbi:MAG: 3-hydroxyacyl-CoA dehydrogenase NAD-binding domain-containing protein [Halioglobus sp.]
MTIAEIKTICFVGAGTMGCYNALAAAVSGYDVVLYDANADSLGRIPQVQKELATMLVGGGYCSEADIKQALARTRVSADLADATQDVDLVSESVFEEKQLKREVHAKLDKCCPERTILTSNSSGLLVSDIEDVVARGDRFAALHSHLGSPLIDIVPGPRTSTETLDILKRYALSTKGEPLVLLKENPGYLLNAMLGPVIGTSLALWTRGDYSRDEIDAAWMSSQSALMGPLGMIDFFGIPLVRDTWQHRNRDDALQLFRDGILGSLESMLADGKLGMKSGAGFYHYPEPDYQQPGFLNARSDSSVSGILQAVLIAHGVILAADEIAKPVDIDRAWCIGTHLVRGPFQLLAESGREAFELELSKLLNMKLIDSADVSRMLTWIKP